MARLSPGWQRKHSSLVSPAHPPDPSVKGAPRSSIKSRCLPRNYKGVHRIRIDSITQIIRSKSESPTVPPVRKTPLQMQIHFKKPWIPLRVHFAYNAAVLVLNAVRKPGALIQETRHCPIFHGKRQVRPTHKAMRGVPWHRARVVEYRRRFILSDVYNSIGQ